MPATNDFLPIATGGGAYVETQATFAADTAVQANGFPAGILTKEKLNKVVRQSSIMASVLAQFIAQQTGSNSVDDGTTATLLANLGKLLQGVTYAISTAGGTSDAITASYAPAIAATPTTPIVLLVQALAANTTTTPVFTPNSGVVANATIVKGLGLPLAPGDIAGAGYQMILQWSPVWGAWILQNPATGIITAPSLAKFDSSLGVNGWRTIPDKNIPGGYLLRAWGQTGGYYGEGGQVITLPASMPNKVLSAGAIILLPSPSISYDMGVQIYGMNPGFPASTIGVYLQIYAGGGVTWPVSAMYWVEGY